MKNKKVYLALIMVMLVTSVLSPIFANSQYVAFAGQDFPGKEEVVYAMLNGDGSADEVYVVNIFEKQGEIIDYGDYSAVRNMTSKDPVFMEADLISLRNTGDKLYYEGEMGSHKIPWDITIKYYLDGEKYKAEEVGGKSGLLRITISIKENKSCDPYFYENYALQISMVFDSHKVKNIKAEDATIFNVGSDKQATFTILPNKGADIEISALVEDFKMDAISINGIRLNLNIEIDDAILMSRINELLEGVEKLDDGANELKDGAGDLKDGTDELLDGSRELQDGIVDLDEGLTSLKKGIRSIDKGLRELNKKSSSLTGASVKMKMALVEISNKLSEVTLTAEKIDEILAGSNAIKNGLEDLKSGIGLLNAGVGYEQYKVTVSASGLDLDELKIGNDSTILKLTGQISQLTGTYNLIKESPDKATDAAILKNQIDEITGIVALLEGSNGAMAATEKYLNSVSDEISGLNTGVATLAGFYDSFNSGLVSLGSGLKGLLVDMSNLSSGINILVSKYTEMDKGLNEYTEGLAKVVVGYKEIISAVYDLGSGSQSLITGSDDLGNGMFELAEASSNLYCGTIDLAEASGKLRDETSNMPKEISHEIDEMISSINGQDEKVISFVSNKNKQVQSVQFVIKTVDIIGEEPVIPKEEPAEKLTFWQKILQLFGIDRY